ncbi:MAG: CIA30 family protein [Myxococcota bacterium]
MYRFGLILLATTACNSGNENSQIVEPDPIDDMSEENFVSYRIDFGSNGTASDWFALNDDVMGGVSYGVVRYDENSVVFNGEVSTDNNGGFVSLRSPNSNFDLADYTDVELSYRSLGHSFTMILAEYNAWYEPKFELEVMPVSEEWNTVRVPLDSFKQYAMTGIGEVETDVQLTSDILSSVLRIELMNTEFESGEFELEIDYIEFQGAVEP